MWKVALISTLALAGCKCNKGDLYDAFTKEAASQLRSPASASFPPADDVITVFGKSTDTCGIIVDGYVDSQNGFGALIRSTVKGTARLIDGSITANVLVSAN